MQRDNFYRDFTPASLFKESGKNLHSEGILTPEDKTDAYNASCLCNRCGACAQNCPSYKALKAEIFSPRGRNQLVRALFERKLNISADAEALKRSVSSCIMCGECSSVCQVNAPTAQLMAEAKYALNCFPGRSFLTSFFAENYKLYFSLQTFKYKLQQNIAEAKALYLTSDCGLENAKASLALINKVYGPCNVMKSGLLLTRAALTEPYFVFQEILNNIFAEYKNLCADTALPLVTDNIEEYRLLKQAARLRGKDFIQPENIIFITELIKNRIKTCPEEFAGKKILLQNNNIFFDGDDIIARTSDIFDCVRNNFLIQLKTKGPNSTGLFSYATNIRGTEEIKREAAFSVASEQPDIFIVFSSADKNFFGELLKKYYPFTKVMHIALAAGLFYDRQG